MSSQTQGNVRPGAHAVYEHIGDDAENLTGFRFRSIERALLEARALRARYPGAHVRSIPTAAQRRAHEKSIAEHKENQLVYWRVCLDQVLPGSGIGRFYPLSPMYANEAQAARALEHLGRVHGVGVYLAKFVENYNPRVPGDLARRAARLAEIAPLSS